MAQSVLGRAPSMPYAYMGLPVNSVCRKASRQTARSYKLACRRAWREAVSARLARGAFVLASVLSRTASPFRTAAAALVYLSAGCAARLRHISNGKTFTLLTAPKTAEMKKPGHLRVNTALAFAAAGVLLFAASIYRVGLEVVLDGESIGYVSRQGIVEDSIAVVSERASEILGRPFTITPDISYRFSIVNKNKLFDSEGVEAGLLSNIPDIDRLCVLIVNGEQIAAAWTPGEIQTVLNEILAEYPSSGRTTFTQEVSIQSQMASLSLLTAPDDLRAKLKSPVSGELKITVNEGDTLDSIARAYRLPVDEILSLNPGVAYPLARGRELLLRRAKPLLSVTYSEHVSFLEEIPYEVVYVDDPLLWAGETKIVTEGSDGEALVRAVNTSVDGYSPETDEIGRLVVTEPVAETIAVGTRTRETTGTFIRPYYGQIASNYGMRTLFGRREMHYGVDFRGPRGDPIIAADGGVVTFAGTMTGYGLVVFIDHENGYKTVYAHSSKLHVRVGQRVGQGEHIANIGSTGRSTGNHLHFEIQVNGVARNPMTYLNQNN
ncbi:MAG: peptidoglycan DD-metalloendopeptidase family protein [Oscillospiraceae bacterium]|nr:peptidoglycan DD-metalloendopeptidase family protein [Oscillospiraceae bacterium]